jgi:hypothetical protein
MWNSWDLVNTVTNFDFYEGGEISSYFSDYFLLKQGSAYVDFVK